MPPKTSRGLRAAARGTCRVPLHRRPAAGASASRASQDTALTRARQAREALVGPVGASKRERRATRTALALLLLGLLAPAASAQLFPALGEDRAGTSGFVFLKVPVDARGAALGETAVSTAADASALFWNPALAAQTDARVVAGAHQTVYFDDIRQSYLAGIARVGPVHLGLSLQALQSGEMEETTVLQPYGTGRTFGFTALAAGLSVSQRLTDLFSYGATVKYVREATAEIATQTALLDLGVFYRVGDTGAQLGVAIRSFGVGGGRPDGDLTRTDVTPGGEVVEVPVESLDRITPPTTFLLGVSYRLLRGSPQHALTLAGQLTNPNDNAERFNVGAEYAWNRLLFLRAGYQFGQDAYALPNFGFGVQVPGIGPTVRLDYGFDHRELLGAVHRVGFDVQL